MSSPPQGFYAIQSALLRDVRSFNPQTQLKVVRCTKVSTLDGREFRECRNECCNTEDGEEPSTPVVREEYAIQQLKNVRQFARADRLPCKISEGLYIGGVGAARNLKALRKCGITHIVNASPVLPNFFAINPKGAFNYFTVPLFDDADADIIEAYALAASFISEGRKTGATLVHCFAGQSRSAALVLAHLISEERLSLEEAFQKILEARPSIRPNTGFMNQLANYSKELQCSH